MQRACQPHACCTSAPHPVLPALLAGKSVLAQWAQEPTLITLTFVLIIAGSLAPLINTGNTEERAGPFTPDAELINGRAACLGFAALLAIEAVKGSALF